MTGSPPTTKASESFQELKAIGGSGNGSEISIIRCSKDVLNAIRRRTTEEFLRIPRGGLEIGGLLYGAGEREEYLISAFTEVPTQYVSGPSFRLSPEDVASFRNAIAAEPPRGANGEALKVVGWWHSHTRSSTAFTDEDADVHKQLFGSAAPLALIVKPHKFEPTEAAVYAASQAGILLAPAQFKFSVGELEPEAALAAQMSSNRVNSPQPLPFPVPALPVPPPKRRPWLLHAAVGILLFLITAAGTALLRMRPISDPVRIELADTDNGLTIRWQVKPAVAASASSAELSIVNERGQTRDLALSPDELRNGSVVYVSSAEKLEIRMRVRSKQNELYDATATFPGRPQPVQTAGSRPPVDPLPPEQVRTRSVIDAPLPDTSVPFRRTEPAVLPAAPVPERQVEKPPVVRTAQLPPLAVRREAPAPQIVAPPPIQLSAVPGQSGMPVGTSQIPALRPPAPLPAASTPPPIAATAPAPKPAPTKPASGRAIWTGTLGAGSTLLIDGNRATMGALTGAIPNRPVRIRVHAADLLDSGLVVYTPAGQERIERPNAANGWNLTTYRPDQRRSNSVAVLESPAPSNGWQRMMVRSSNRGVSAIVIDWEEVTPQQ